MAENRQTSGQAMGQMIGQTVDPAVGRAASKAAAMGRAAARALVLALAVVQGAVIAPAPARAADGLVVRDLTLGTGTKAERGARVTVQYSGWLTDGTLFDSSRTAGRPFTFRLADGEVIRGWDRGVEGMREGGTRELVIAPELAYGAKGAPPRIPPNATLRFEIELISTATFPYTNIDNRTLRDLMRDNTVTAIDVRPAGQAEQGFIPGSVRLPAFAEGGRFQPEFLARLAREVPRDRPLALLSADGDASGVVAGYLATQGGFAKVYNLYDGIDGWRNAGYPLDR